KKDVGNLTQVETSVHLKDMPGSIAIGHTRWATHGGINVCNAHPHLDCKGRVAVVHNGVIENYQELRQQLQQRGHVFASQTDSEVIPHLIEEFMDNGMPLEVAVSSASAELQGSFAFLAIAVKDPGKMVGAKRDNPLVLGVGNGGVFASSDCISFLEHTNEIIYVEDGEVPVVSSNEFFFVKEGNGRIKKEPTKVSWQHQDVQKGVHPYFMMKEIIEQPQAVRRAVVQDRDIFTELAMDILRANQVIITACGSSRYAALVGRYLFSKIGGKFCDVVMAPEFHYFSDSVDKNTLVIAVSQSGETADVVEGVKRASANGAKVCSIVNRDGTILSNLSDKVIQLNVGPEIAVAATKSFSGQLAIFYLLSYAMVNRFSTGVQKIKEVSKAMETVIDYNNGNLEKLAKQLKDSPDFYFIARGTNFAIASEGALKLKEISYIHAEGLPAGELKHGTIALIEEKTPVVVICPKDHTFSETLTNAIEAKSRGAYIIGVSDEENEAYDSWIKIPPVEEMFYPMVAVIPLQLLAYHAAVCRGNNPDRPRNLAKSVTVK
ncbi:MAG: glutamine--fructose-6-phosphate transaminase (isomerizing), partial [Chloroflexota bacterium]|nr:glutamine--fructose-6-phosphate transaminase (isomerizing) [Chloroflexota bacterium]